MIMDRIKASIEKQLTEMKTANFQSHDPYSGLLGFFGERVELSRSLSRQIVIQGCKRSRVLRSLNQVPKIQMVKSAALVIPTYKFLSELSMVSNLHKTILLNQNIDGGWGYEFDVQTRWGYYAKGQSNVVVTAFVIMALNELNLLNIEIKEKVLQFLESTISPEGFFQYSANSSPLVHNANLLAAMTYIKVGGNSVQVERALHCSQNGYRSGYFPYGEGNRLNWEDSYHASYILWALGELSSDIGIPQSELDSLNKSWYHKFILNGKNINLLSLHEISDQLFWLNKIQGTDLTEIEKRVIRIDQWIQSTDNDRFFRWDASHAVRALTECLQSKSLNNG